MSKEPSTTLDLLLNLDRTEMYLDLERYWNEGSPSGFHRTVSVPYSPWSSQPDFMLPVFGVDKLQCIQIGELSLDWSKEIQLDGRLPIPLHPDIVSGIVACTHEFSTEPKFFLRVIPTASGRTVLVRPENEPAHFIKLHYPKVLGRFNRDLSLHKWLVAIENSRELFSIQALLPNDIGFLHDFAGIYFDDLASNKGFGTLFREYQPRPANSDSETILIPAFALFARRRLRIVVRPLIVQLLEQEPNPLDAFVSQYARLAIKAFIYLACEQGLIPESHAQNILYEVSTTNGGTRVIFRDLGDFFIDMEVRRSRSLHRSFCSYKSIDETAHDFYMRRSFAYDFKLGEYLLRPMCEAVAKGFRLPLSQVLGAVKEEAQMLWKNARPWYFDSPTHWYQYPKRDSVGREDYIKSANPRFR